MLNLNILYSLEVSLLTKPFFLQGPARFETHPISVEVSNYSQVQLSCSYNNYTAVSFRWKKYDSVLDISKITNGTATTVSSRGTGVFSGSTKMTHRLSFRILRAEEQGFYWCSVLDSFNRIVDSNKANVRLTGIYNICNLFLNILNCVA